MHSLYYYFNPAAALQTKLLPEGNPFRNPPQKTESQFMWGCTFTPQGEEYIKRKKMPSSNVASRVYEMLKLFMTHMWWIKTIPCDL